ncbi:MAG: glycosyltransferase family 2 protein [Candidatus Hodarchaeota archaeon]
MLKHLVSIITLAYNHDKFIKKCIESVLAQTYTSWEQIIIDDGSTDRTAEIIEQYANRDKRIKFIRHEENLGIFKLGEIYNEALNVSKGEFIAILEGDDLWPKYKLDKQLKLFSNKKIVLTWGKGKIIDKNGNIIGTLPQAWKKWPDNIVRNKPVGNALKILLRHFYTSPAVTLMFNHQSLLDIGGFWQPKGYFAIDYPTCLKISLKGEFSYSKEILGYWRTHHEQVTSTLAHMSQIIVTDIFWNSLSSEEKKKLDNNKAERILKAWSCWIKGRRLMALGEKKQARKMFVKSFFLRQGWTSMKAGIALLFSFIAPLLLQYKFSTPLTFFSLFKKLISHRSII